MRTMFVNPSRSKRRKRRKARNAPRPWASLYARKYGSLAKRKKHKRKSRKSKPHGKHGMKVLKYSDVAKALKARSRKNPKHVTLSRKDLNKMLLNRNPRRRRAKRSHRRSKRRNAGITPFIQANPRRRSLSRRRRSSNPSFPSMQTMWRKSLTYGGGAAVGEIANMFVLNKIENHWLRSGARVLTACMAAPMLGGDLGAAAGGVIFSPIVKELAIFFKIPGIATEADLEADLQDLLNDMSSSPDASRGLQVDADLW